MCSPLCVCMTQAPAPAPAPIPCCALQRVACCVLPRRGAAWWGVTHCHRCCRAARSRCVWTSRSGRQHSQHLPLCCRAAAPSTPQRSLLQVVQPPWAAAAAPSMAGCTQRWWRLARSRSARAALMLQPHGARHTRCRRAYVCCQRAPPPPPPPPHPPRTASCFCTTLPSPACPH